MNCKYKAESTKKYIVFSENWGRGGYQDFFDCRSCMCSAGFYEFHFKSEG